MVSLFFNCSTAEICQVCEVLGKLRARWRFKKGAAKLCSCNAQAAAVKAIQGICVDLLVSLCRQLCTLATVKQ